MLRILIILSLLLFVTGCSKILVSKTQVELITQEFGIKHGHMSGYQNKWFYTGTSNGYHNLKHFTLIGNSNSYRIPGKLLNIYDTFPPTKDRNKWIELSGSGEPITKPELEHLFKLNGLEKL